jgi:hypothetical protein
MIGMLVGLAALTAWGLYRFNQILKSLPDTKTDATNLAARLAAEAEKYRIAFAMQYGSIFWITAIVCLVGAVLALFIAGRHTHSDEPEPDPAQVVPAQR